MFNLIFPSDIQGVFSFLSRTVGAPESILDRCSSIMLPDGTLAPPTEDSKKLILGKMLEMAGRG